MDEEILAYNQLSVWLIISFMLEFTFKIEYDWFKNLVPDELFDYKSNQINII